MISAEYLKGVTQAGFTQTMLGSTSSGTGTTMYLAPEIVAGSPATTRSDLYSLGVVLYQLLTGDFRRPLTADWTRDIDDPLLREDLQSCLAGRASDRFAGAIQLARHLRELPARRTRLREQQAAVEQASRAAARRAAIRTAAVAAGLVIAFAWLAGAAIVQGRRARASAEAAAQQREIAEQRLYAADLSLATRAREDGQSGRLHDLLERHRPSATNPVDRRDWLWRWLWVQSRSDEVRTLSHSGDQSTRLCYSPDGRLLIAGGRDGELTVWDTTTWELVKRLALQSGLRSLDVSPDGKWLAAVGGGRLRVWDLQTGELQDEAEVNQSWGWDIDRGGGAARFTARSDLLLLGDTGVGQLHLRDFREHRTIHSLDLHRRGISALAVSADGRLLASAALGPEIRLWEFQGRTNLTLVRPIESGDGGLLFDLAFAPSGDWLAGAGLSGPGWAGTYCRAWQVDLTNVFHDLEGHSGWVGGARFTLDGQSLLTVGADQTVRLWNAEDWKLAGRFQGHLNEVSSLAVSPDGRSFATGDKNSEVKIWDLFNHGDDRHTLLIQDRVERFIASVDRTGFATRNDQGTVQFWDSASLEALPTPALPPGEIYSLDLRGGFAVVGSNRIQLVNLTDGTARELSAEVTPFFRFHTHLSADGRFLFFPEQHATRMLRLPEAVAVASLEEPGELLPAAISARGRYALFRTPERANLRLWDFHLLRTYPITLGGPTPTGVHARFSPNEELCATVGSHGVLHLFKLEATGPRLCAQIDPNLGALSNLDFSPDGRTLVVATVPGRLWFLDLGSLQESGKVGGYRCMYQGPHTTLAFSNDGKNLIVHDIYRQSVYALRAPSLAEIDATAKPLASVAPATIP